MFNNDSVGLDGDYMDAVRPTASKPAAQKRDTRFETQVKGSNILSVRSFLVSVLCLSVTD